MTTPANYAKLRERSVSWSVRLRTPDRLRFEAVCEQLGMSRAEGLLHAVEAWTREQERRLLLKTAWTRRESA